MSIATELEALNTNIKNVYNAIDTKGGTIPQNKNMVNLPTAINSISGGSPSFLCGGLNPTVVETLTQTFNLANDTTYNSITPGTSDQTILNTSSSLYQTSSAFPIDQYDYYAIEDVFIDHVYNASFTEVPFTGYTLSVAYKCIKYPVKSYSSQSSDYDVPKNISQVQQSNVLQYYKYPLSNGTNTYLTSSYSYGIHPSSLAISQISYLNNYTKIQFTFRNPQIKVRTNETYMGQSMWQYIDATKTNIYIRRQIIRIDGRNELNYTLNMMKNDAFRHDGTIDSNFIILQ